jgi:DNA-binding response OmpR family regulator
MVTVVDEKRKGFALGAAEYLVKPVDRAELLQAVRRLAPLPGRAPEAVLTIEHTAEGQRELFEAVLAAGYRPLAARDGREAMRVLAQVRPGAVVVSLLLPEQDAFQTILRLRADPVWSDLPVLALAPEDLSLYHIRLLSSGPTRVVYQQARSWKERLVPELHQLLGQPAPVS